VGIRAEESDGLEKTLLSVETIGQAMTLIRTRFDGINNDHPKR